MPTGGIKSAGILENLLGDANAAFRTDWLRSHRYSEARNIGTHDWDLFVRLLNEDERALDVIPEVLFYYRHRPDSMNSNQLALG